MTADAPQVVTCKNCAYHQECATSAGAALLASFHETEHPGHEAIPAERSE